MGPLLLNKQVKPIPPPIILIPFPEVATNVFRIMTYITKLIQVSTFFLQPFQSNVSFPINRSASAVFRSFQIGALTENGFSWNIDSPIGGLIHSQNINADFEKGLTHSNAY